MQQEVPIWPVLRTYDAAHSIRVALPLGGIGTGTITLGGRGDLRDWELRNRPAKGFAPDTAMFLLRVAEPDGTSQTRLLEGPIDPTQYEGGHGSQVKNHGLPRFRESEFHAAYPLGQLLLDDPDSLVSVRLQAFNPLVPTDADASGIPVAVLRYVVTNKTDRALDIAIAGSVQNFLAEERNANANREASGARGVLATTTGRETGDREWGSFALAVVGEDENDVTTRTSWADGLGWSGELLDFWSDFTADGRLDERETEAKRPVASVAAGTSVGAGETRALTFVLAWHFPNRKAWEDEDTTVGNYYTTKYADAWAVVADTAPQLAELERRTVDFVRAFVDSDLPVAVKDAALSNVSTLRTETCFRTPDGRFFGWEGCSDGGGCCYGNCTHVWNYEQTTPFLFGALAKSMRETEFVYGTGADGHMNFRIPLPLGEKKGDGVAAADGQMGCLVKLYREWKLSGDEDLLRTLWPKARKALEFAWIPGGWDADQDGVMEGSQHNTMDVEYFGPNPEVGSWYLAALRAGEEIARHVGDDEFAARCADLFARGSAWLDEHLFNGAYYVHEIRPVGSEDAIAPGLRLPGIGARNLLLPEFQIGDGCLADQLVGQYLAHIVGLGHLLNVENIKTTLQTILRENRREGVWEHFNPVRSYTLGDETGLLVASYPNGNQPERPFPYYAEVWTGLEYTAAIGMIYEGLVDEGVAVIETVRGRYDGQRRNPFDEAECGHHYVRAMAAWGAVPALTGFAYDGTTGALTFASSAQPVSWFWSNGHAFGTVRQEGGNVKLDVLGGEVRVDTLTLTGKGEAAVNRTLTAGDSAELTVPVP
ncbi:GH116 family glycosyl-hydrolase [Tenggerimyces flavus]|uniref:GH116 family glycosyl-hydrolase n=1 Tax=Tenggerimyces flavus TaxID=1708749 RepID=A0ABV7YQU3_9ACTN|nr:GH116 family glycosyl-hydrolase [Tenggerimyces flavus]MBM7790433.1 uncharacterized protein (DUF608 family) [Tenggerimyces flavus]